MNELLAVPFCACKDGCKYFFMIIIQENFFLYIPSYFVGKEAYLCYSDL